jgi:hypothetical protein
MCAQLQLIKIELQTGFRKGQIFFQHFSTYRSILSLSNKIHKTHIIATSPQNIIRFFSWTTSPKNAINCGFKLRTQRFTNQNSNNSNTNNKNKKRFNSSKAENKQKKSRWISWFRLGLLKRPFSLDHIVGFLQLLFVFPGIFILAATTTVIGIILWVINRSEKWQGPNFMLNSVFFSFSIFCLR